MKTFEEIKEEKTAGYIHLIQKNMKELERNDLKDFEKKVAEQQIKDCQTYIDNIEEVVTIEIGAATNNLIESIQEECKNGGKLTTYWDNFEQFIDKYIVSLNSDGSLGRGRGLTECLVLGIGPNELLLFKGRNPMNSETGDLFRQMINANFGTNIPMADVKQQAIQDYEAVCFGDNQDAKDKAFVHLKEVQRDSGDLKNGVIYYILANNQEYQEAKSRCSGKSI